MTAATDVARLEAERLRPVPPPAVIARRPLRPGEAPVWLPDLDRLIAVLAGLMLETP